MVFNDLLKNIVNHRLNRIAAYKEGLGDDVIDLLSKYGIENNNGYYVITTNDAELILEDLNTDIFENQWEYDFQRTIANVRTR